jgi:hypothetical protein
LPTKTTGIAGIGAEDPLMLYSAEGERHIIRAEQTETRISPIGGTAGSEVSARRTPGYSPIPIRRSLNPPPFHRQSEQSHAGPAKPGRRLGQQWQRWRASLASGGQEQQRGTRRNHDLTALHNTSCAGVGRLECHFASLAIASETMLVEPPCHLPAMQTFQAMRSSCGSALV